MDAISIIIDLKSNLEYMLSDYGEKLDELTVTTMRASIEDADEFLKESKTKTDTNGE